MHTTPDESVANDDAWADSRTSARTTSTAWRQYSDDLTASQIRHLAALERIAVAHVDSDGEDTARDILDSLDAEAARYAALNPEPGVEAIGTFRGLVATLPAEAFGTEDVMAVLGLLERVMAYRDTTR